MKPLDDTNNLTMFGAKLVISPMLRDDCEILKELIHCYVINRPALATQQKGQERLLHTLMDALVHDPDRLLPVSRREEYGEYKEPVRSAADAVASFTESEAAQLYFKITGVNWGQLRDIY